MNTKAFSLVEIIVGLLIISVALAVFAPVFNKKVKTQSVALDSKLTEKCSAFGPNCSLCQGTKYCAVCTKGCGLDEHLDIANCKCVSN